jgi:hypothetical protein
MNMEDKHSEVCHNVCISPDIIRVNKSRFMRWNEHEASIGGGGGAYKTVVGKPQGKSLRVRPRNKREDNIKMILKKQGVRGVDWIHVLVTKYSGQWWDDVSTIMNLRVA